MLNRYQVLLSDWQEDYIKFVVQRYNLNDSSAIRLHFSLGIIYAISSLFPEYKPGLSKNGLRELAQKVGTDELKEEEVHQWISKVLLEARKAVEFRLANDKKEREK